MLEEEAALLAGVEHDVRYIVAEHKSITSFLTTISTRRNLDAELKNWVQELSEVAYDAEDSIDEFDRHKTIRDHLHGKRYLLVLDDVWSIEAWESLSIALPQGIFPEDYEIGRKRLMRRWIAEGIVSDVGGFPAEKVAERCFNELVGRSLVQPSKFNYNGTVKSCRVHDMMLQVIISISKKLNFAVLLNEHPTNLPQYQKIRRLSWHGGSSGLGPNTDLCHLRSFTSFGEDVPPPKDYRKQRLLRAIDLEGCRNLRHLHPKSFSKLFLLKYLFLRNTRGLHRLPDSIGDLQNLEFLDIRGTDIEELSNTIVKLQKLVYLLGGPIEIGELVHLQKLGISFYGSDLSLRMLEKISALLSKLNGSLRSLKTALGRHQSEKSTR
ncbi:hypothetical protein ZIOFF_014260 [Zingiber officinale]|uniref:NB-ARC domain-containing protein n=1 Tax=Zingiber officinale TaxID=94328 RepID=A0A8J5HH51_ZINOF|nr:hypothetical protein ZIOFF_014260 [Zingiber officinale]